MSDREESVSGFPPKLRVKCLAFPWQEAMAFGFGYLKLSSKEFWSLTPKELYAAMRYLAPLPSTYPSKESLHHLMTLFPDHSELHHE
jgi:uncharacterized phage protein (TIGR02216 family)